MLSSQFQISSQRSADIHINRGGVGRADEINMADLVELDVLSEDQVLSDKNSSGDGPLEKAAKLERVFLLQKRPKLLESEKSNPPPTRAKAKFPGKQRFTPCLCIGQG